jgi:hypothetical protein
MRLNARRFGWSLLLLLGALCGAATNGAARAQESIIDSPEFTDPNIPAAKLVKMFPERLLSLWLQALARPEYDYQCQAAATIAQAHRRGMPGLSAAVEPLMSTLDQREADASVRLAVAQALITLDARQAAALLFAHAQADGVDMRNLIEPALARWQFAAAGPGWLERLTKASQPTPAQVLAMRGLLSLREMKAKPRLRELVLGSTSDPVLRLEAARTLGSLQAGGLEPDAEALLAEKPASGSIAHLLAATLLKQHRNPEAALLLQRLTGDSDLAAVAVAEDALLQFDPKRILPQVLASKAAGVRTRGVLAFGKIPNLEQLPLVIDRLDDVHPQVRTAACKTLAQVAQKPEYGTAIRRLATAWLLKDRWRALEQAAILLTLLDEKAVAPRLVELLRFERPEVFVAAAWGLRKLAVPSTLPDQLREIERRWQRSAAPDARYKDMLDRELAQLCWSMGQAKYAPAAPVLARFIPKQVLTTFGPQSRIAAIWALGLILEKASSDVVQALIGRLTDEAMVFVEDMGVRRMCAITLGRMKAADALEALSKYYPKALSPDPFPNACGWALEQITGEKLPSSGIAKVVQKGWFLESVE